MDKARQDPQDGSHPGGPKPPARNGGSGEGSRSAMERLIQQQRKRDAQQPREAGEPNGSARKP